MRADLRSGRTSQKERTRDALIDAARLLLDRGETLTIVRAAEIARVSQATAYRYYAAPETLLRDALTPAWPTVETILRELDGVADALDRARRAAQALAAIVLRNEGQTRALIALTYTSRDRGEPAPARPQLRKALIAAILDPLRPRLPPEALDRVTPALLAAISAETVLSLKDSGAFSDAEIVATTGWIAECIVARVLPPP